jgi:hypothetical protein
MAAAVSVGIAEVVNTAKVGGAAEFMGTAGIVDTAVVVGVSTFVGAAAFVRTLQLGSLQVWVGMVVQAQASGPVIVTYSPIVLPLAHMQ